mgnify:CR=1 FL=1
MTRFSFRLQRVLELREKKEQAMATQAAAARAQADAARAAREALEHIRAAGRERLHEAHAREAQLPSVGELQQMGLVLEALDTRVAQASTTHAAAEQAARTAQEQLTEAFRDRRVLDRLKEKQQHAWKAEAVRQDLATMDGIALTRFVQDAALRESTRLQDADTPPATPGAGAPAHSPDEDR